MTFKLPVVLRSESFTGIRYLSLGSVTTSEQRRLRIDEPEHMQVAVIISESKRFDYTRAFSFERTYLASYNLPAITVKELRHLCKP